VTTGPDTGAGSGAETALTPEEALPPATGGVAAPPETVSGYLRRRWESVRAGDLGSLPIVVGLVVIAIVFGTLDNTFFVERNFTNLLLQMAPVATIAIGIVAPLRARGSIQMDGGVEEIGGRPDPRARLGAGRPGPLPSSGVWASPAGRTSSPTRRSRTSAV